MTSVECVEVTDSLRRLCTCWGALGGNAAMGLPSDWHWAMAHEVVRPKGITGRQSQLQISTTL